MLASIALIALSSTSCATNRKTVSTATEKTQARNVDSLATAKTLVTAKPVKADTARLALALSDIISLPENIPAAVKTGRAAAAVRRQGDTVVIYAACDSLSRLVAFYQEQTARSAAEDRQQSETASKDTSSRSGRLFKIFIAYLFGFACGGLAVIAVNRVKDFEKKFNS